MITQKIIAIKDLSLLSKFFILGTFIACTNTQSSPFKYEKEFKNYLLDVFKIGAVSDAIFYIFPMSSCNFCTEESLKTLETCKSKNIILVLVGDVKNQNEERMLKLPMPKLLDPSQKAYSYAFGLTKPLLIHIKGKECIRFFEINDTDLQKIRSYLSVN
ncbi:hypothetical protein [Runella slithyformis]|uniref:Redoxin domain-containing protein n=1 Tax=Runella slithyformis (strain ATCC 29530 / DSM 19594 / LMG 11500 / NCIMB 11436 / LSU 4) TaxID=761193 RepID=A0A7U3ZM77_RUNSL|nr:hypothetical protein [Runella slithyformis]AEI49643.1 hypothetical protein Runsl_3268 [Runella slithyformis DSM 19594]